MEGKRLRVLAGARLAISAAVSVQYDDAMFLGEVMVCRKESADAWHIEIGVEQILTGLQSLMALRVGLLGDAAAIPRGFVPIAAQN